MEVSKPGKLVAIEITPEMVEAAAEFLADSGYVQDCFATRSQLFSLCLDLLAFAIPQTPPAESP